MEKHISIIIPVYNSEMYLAKCIESVCEIKDEETEILLVDDGSSDRSGQICDYYAHRDKRIRVFHQENKGVSVARNLGILQARGEWICFVDSDDWLSEHFEQQVIKKIREDVDIVYFGALQTVQENVKETVDPEQDVLENEQITALRLGLLNMDNKQFQQIKNGKFIYTVPWGKLYKKELLEKYKIFFDENLVWGEDIVFLFEILKYTKRVQTISQRGYFYRENDSSISRSYNKDAVIFYLKMMESLEKRMNIVEDDERIWNNFYLCIIRQFLFTSQRSIFHIDNLISKQEVWKQLREVRKMPLMETAFQRADLNEFRMTVHIPALAFKHEKYCLLYLMYKIKYMLK